MKTSKKCTVKSHCILSDNCPADSECAMQEIIKEKLSKENFLTCGIMGFNNKKVNCTFLPLRKMTINECECNDGKECFYYSLFWHNFWEIFEELDEGCTTSSMNSRLEELKKEDPLYFRSLINLIKKRAKKNERRKIKGLPEIGCISCINASKCDKKDIGKGLFCANWKNKDSLWWKISNKIDSIKQHFRIADTKQAEMTKTI